MTWREVNVGDVIHWCLGQPYSKSWLVVSSRLRAGSGLRNTLFNLDTGETITDNREAGDLLLGDVWTVDRATLPSERRGNK